MDKIDISLISSQLIKQKSQQDALVLSTSPQKLPQKQHSINETKQIDDKNKFKPAIAKVKRSKKSKIDQQHSNHSIQEQDSVPQININYSAQKLQSQYKLVNKSQNSGNFSNLDHQQDHQNSSNINMISYGQNSNKNVREIGQFANAWKSQTGLGILLMEKLSIIVQNYYKILPQIAKRNEQIQILVVYNKGLIDILNKFQDQQKKLITKLRTLEQFNLKIMKQLCHIKNKPLKIPQLKPQQSIFQKFSLKQLTYQPAQKNSEIVDLKYNDKLLKIFQTHLLDSVPQSALNLVEEKIKQIQEKEIIRQKEKEKEKKKQNQKQKQGEHHDKSVGFGYYIEQLRELRDKIVRYRKEKGQVTCENMFDLFELKNYIKQEMKNLDIIDGQQQKVQYQENQKKFASQILKLQAGLEKMDESDLQNFLKKQKQIRKSLRKKRLKQQQVFIRMCQKVESQNAEMIKDMAALQQKNRALQQQLNKNRADQEMRQLRAKINRSSIIDQSIEENDVKSSKRLAKQTHNRMSIDLKKLKQQNEKLHTLVNQQKQRQASKPSLLKKLIQRGQKYKIIIDPSWQQLQIIQALMLKLGQLLKQKSQKKPKVPIPNNNMNEGHLDNQFESPHLDLNTLGLGFDAVHSENAQLFLKTISEQSEMEEHEQQLEVKTKQLEKQTKQLQKKNDQSKKHIQKLNKSLLELETDIKNKTSKINELVKEYERFQNQIKELKFQKQLLSGICECSAKLSQGMVAVIEQLKSIELDPMKFINIIDEIINKFDKIIQEYNKQISKKKEIYDERRQMILQRDGERQQNSSRYNNPNDTSSASLRSRMNKSREKRQYDLISVPGKQEENKILKQSMFKKIKSLNNLLSEQNQQLTMKKSNSPKKFSLKVGQQQHSFESQNDLKGNRKYSALLTIQGQQKQVSNKLMKSQQSGKMLDVQKEKNNEQVKSANSQSDKNKNNISSGSKSENQPKQMQNFLDFLQKSKKTPNQKYENQKHKFNDDLNKSQDKQHNSQKQKQQKNRSKDQSFENSNNEHKMFKSDKDNKNSLNSNQNQRFSSSQSEHKANSFDSSEKKSLNGKNLLSSQKINNLSVDKIKESKQSGKEDQNKKDQNKLNKNSKNSQKQIEKNSQKQKQKNKLNQCLQKKHKKQQTEVNIIKQKAGQNIQQPEQTTKQQKSPFKKSIQKSYSQQKQIQQIDSPIINIKYQRNSELKPQNFKQMQHLSKSTNLKKSGLTPSPNLSRSQISLQLQPLKQNQQIISQRSQSRNSVLPSPGLLVDRNNEFNAINLSYSRNTENPITHGQNQMPSTIISNGSANSNRSINTNPNTNPNNNTNTNTNTGTGIGTNSNSNNGIGSNGSIISNVQRYGVRDSQQTNSNSNTNPSTNNNMNINNNNDNEENINQRLSGRFQNSNFNSNQGNLRDLANMRDRQRQRDRDRDRERRDNTINDNRRQSGGSSRDIREAGRSQSNINIRDNRSDSRIGQLRIENREIRIPNLANLSRNSMNDSRGGRIFDFTGPEAVLQHERIMEKIKKLSDADDALDFAQLYQRYKIALQCLQQAEQVNRMQKLRYQRYINNLRNRQKDENLSLQKQLFYLSTKIEQQQRRIKQDDIKFTESITVQIKKSEDVIKDQLKMLREGFKISQQMESQTKKYFLDTR